MKRKVQAQRKFAQGAFVPPTPVVTERRTNEPPPDHEIKVINHANISAKKILDSLSFSQPGMHLHLPRVVLERLEPTSFTSGASLVATPSTSAEPETKKRTKNRKPKQIYENKSTRILRSMRNRQQSSSETNNSDDDMPLTYHLAKKDNGPAHSGSRKRKPTAKVQRQTTATPTVSKTRKQEVPANQFRVPAKQSSKKRPKDDCPVPRLNPHRACNPELTLDHCPVPRLSPHRARNPELTLDHCPVPRLSPHRARNPELTLDDCPVPRLSPHRARNPELTLDDCPVPRLSPHRARNPELTLGSRKRKPTAKVQRQTTATSTVSKKRKQKVPAKHFRVPAKQSSKKRPKDTCPLDLVRPSPVPEELQQDGYGFTISVIKEDLSDDTCPLDLVRPSLVPEELQQDGHGFTISVINEALSEDKCPLDLVRPNPVPEELQQDGYGCTINVIKEALSDDDQITPCESPGLHLDHDDQFTPCESPDLRLDHVSEVDFAIPSSSSRNDEDPLGDNSGVPEESESSFGTTEAPVFYPTEEEFTDILQYYQKIAPVASTFGICKVVAPASFQPLCKTDGLEHTSVSAQYPARFYKRWGEGVREICAMKKYLASHCVYMTNVPKIKRREINLPAMFRAVKKYGGFLEVSNKKLWGRIATEMKLIAVTKPDKRLDQLYLKFLLPYDILTDEERNTIKAEIDAKWQQKQQQMQKRADNPLHMRKVYLGESDESSDDCNAAEEDGLLREAFRDVEECVKHASGLSLTVFMTQSEQTAQTYFPKGSVPSVNGVEALFWKKVLEASDHDCILAASVDTSEFGYGFTTDPNDPMSRHPWNLKNVRNNPANILRSLGAVVPTTVPILHLGMIFAANCWHRDPHCLPWVEYLHKGHEKVWYGVPEHEGENFRRAVERLCPTSVQNKKIWLASDITLIPPNLLLDEGVVLTKLVQKPGEFIFVFPKAYSSSICIGFNISESVYFAVDPWQLSMKEVFQELRESCEPMNFSPEQLLIAMARDERVSRDLLSQVYPLLFSLLEAELQSRADLLDRGVPEIHVTRQGNRPSNIRGGAECNVCRRPLYLSKVTVKNYKKLKQACPQDAYKILTKLEESPGTSDSTDRPVDFVLETSVTDNGLRRILSTCQKRL